MTIPIRNHLLDIIKQKENYTDKELEKALTKDGTIITEGEFNKVLLDLEIMGLINVSWVTKENRRIEAVTEKMDVDEYEEQIKETQEKDYEASFPSS
jgi:DNA-binding PadR family transcriptional regulator|tara:strand:- start:451 stop:741 length:291 start_codon:yes stop_codon:yes gene_type:complete